MSHPAPNKTGPLKIFYDQLEDYLSMDGYFQFFSKRKNGDTNAFLYSDIFSTEKEALLA